MKYLLPMVLWVVLSGCSELRVKRYQNILDPLVGNSKKTRIDQLLGNPIVCTPESSLEKCEYRTSRGRNHSVPDVYRKEDAMGPDVSPYDYFDVLHLYYDNLGVLREWVPVVVK